MPTYDYRCVASNQLITVRHPMAVTIRTWGELCQLAERDPGTTALDTPVEKVLSFGGVVRSSSLKNPSAPPCMAGGSCPGGGCGG